MLSQSIQTPQDLPVPETVGPGDEVCGGGTGSPGDQVGGNSPAVLPAGPGVHLGDGSYRPPVVGPPQGFKSSGGFWTCSRISSPSLIIGATFRPMRMPSHGLTASRFGPPDQVGLGWMWGHVTHERMPKRGIAAVTTPGQAKKPPYFQVSFYPPVPYDDVNHPSCITIFPAFHLLISGPPV